MFGTVCNTLIIEGNLIATAFYTNSVAKIATIQTLAVTEQYRDLGLGKYFMTELQQMNVVEWHVHATNDSVEFYEKCGFEKWSETKHHTTDLFGIKYVDCTYLVYKNPNVQEVVQCIENIAEDIYHHQRCVDGIKEAIAKNSKRKFERIEDIAKNEKLIELSDEKINDLGDELKKLKSERTTMKTTYEHNQTELENESRKVKDELARLQNELKIITKKLDTSTISYEEERDKIQWETKAVAMRNELEKKKNIELNQEKDRLASAMEEINKFQEAIDTPIIIH